MLDSSLPNDIDKLKEMVIAKNAELAKTKREMKDLLDYIQSLRRKIFAPSSEIVHSNQLNLFNEIEDIVHEDNGSDEEEITYKRKKRGHRNKIPDHIPRKTTIEDVPEDQKFCPHDGTPLVQIGEEVSEKLKFIPAKVEVERTVRPKYGCPCCKDGVKIAGLPIELLPKTMATASLVAFIIVSKFADHLPLYRQEGILKRIGIEISRQTMARWLIQVTKMLVPVFNLLEELLLEDFYAQMDETRYLVLNEKNKKTTSKSYIWVRLRPIGEPIILFDYDPTRSGQVPIRLLENFQGKYLQVDGYDGYSKVCTENKLVRLGCMNHCRSKFEKAFKSSKGKGIGKKGLVYLKKLYKIEEKIKDSTPEIRFNIRREKSEPILIEMKEWIDEVRPKITPTSLGGKAINYAYNEWEYLTAFLKDGRLQMTNIMIENGIRPIALGRKNYLFSASVDGAESSCLLYSLLETAKKNNLDQLDYMASMLEKLPHAKTVDDFEKLLPLKSKFDPDSI